MTNYERFSEGFEKTEEIQIEAVKMLLDQIMEDYQSHEDDRGDSEWAGLIPYEKVIAWALLPEPYKPEDIKEAPWKNRTLGDFMKGANR